MATLSTSDSLAGASEATEFGAAIRDMRLAHNADLATVASTLRIRQVYLQAIEDGRFDELPGPTYAAGFVRAYAEYLGLDLSEVMRRYREVALGSDRQAPLVAPSPVVEGTMPTGFILLVAAVLAAIAYGSWYYLTLHGRDAGDIVARLPQQIAEIVGLEPGPPETSTSSTGGVVTPASTMESAQIPADQPAPAAVPEPEAPVASEESSESDNAVAAAAQSDSEVAESPSETDASRQAEAADTPAAPAASPPVSESSTETEREAAPPVSEVARTSPKPAAVPAERPSTDDRSSSRSDTVETTPLPAPSLPPVLADDAAPDAPQTAALPDLPTVAADPELPSRVVLRATAISWVELRDASGKRVFSRLLKKGETYNVPGASGMTLATGNAGALDVLVDGQTIGPLGPVGAVRRDVLMEPDALLRRSSAR